jgi:hypothetical protein
MVGAIECFSFGSFPCAIARQAMPHSDALLRAAARLADSADASLPIHSPAPVVDS